LNGFPQPVYEAIPLAEIERLGKLLTEANAKRERAVSQAQLTRSGYVYVISNIGSFGEDVYKIGTTRRLDPQDRVDELGDASVPFPFDVHAMIFTQDAPGLEHALHRAFEDRRVNLVNPRKEFFCVFLEEVDEVARKHQAQVSFTLAAEASQYQQSKSLRLSRLMVGR
jgi:Meiotically up-regulated gene 113